MSAPTRNEPSLSLGRCAVERHASSACAAATTSQCDISAGSLSCFNRLRAWLRDEECHRVEGRLLPRVDVPVRIHGAKKRCALPGLPQACSTRPKLFPSVMKKMRETDVPCLVASILPSIFPCLTGSHGSMCLGWKAAVESRRSCSWRCQGSLPDS